MTTNYLKRAQRRDRAATFVITAGGMGVVASVILILFLIVSEALPLLFSASIESVVVHPIAADSPVLAVGIDEYRAIAYAIHEDGSIRFYNAITGAPEGTHVVAARDAIAVEVSTLNGSEYTILWSDGVTTLIEVSTRPEYEGTTRHLVPVVQTVAELASSSDELPLRAQLRHQDDIVTRVDLLPGDAIAVTQQRATGSALNDVTEVVHSPLNQPLPGAITDFVLDGAGAMLYVATDNGYLIRWSVRGPGTPVLLGSIRVHEDRAVTALAPVLGDVSLAVGDAAGGLSTWSPMPAGQGTARPPRKNHMLTPHETAVRHIVPSQRTKSLLSLDDRGTIHLDHMTSERHLLQLSADVPLSIMNFAPRGNGVAALGAGDRLVIWSIANEHPEVSWRTLLGSVWYENYDAPEYVWQSSAATDTFEPKLSLVPLLFGSLKGTFYAMLFAIPLSLFGAMYTSQFAANRVRGAIKPAVEVMAAVPSVVIGFLCALWLAPLIEDHVVAFLAAPLVIAATVLMFVLAWQFLRRTWLGARVEHGYEFVALAPVLACGALLAYWAGQPLESLLFNGDFALWLYESFGERYDQRNAIVIAFGLGFAVIPIMFTIADDAISSVPYSLKAASMALGATRWQTVWRVVLPAASPGIFAGMMIGFGRAVGETMIVLMATGNTPIMDWSIFNGMRTLSANIAVEIPEAPVDSTLYRVLFLSAVLLFMLTFTVNTVAELVRQSLRKKYGQFQ